MTGTEPENGPERQVLSRHEAEKLAEDHRASGQPDPFPRVPASLLSAEHIKDYVLKTGAIAPFYENGGRHSRLKMATYEGRIGECAYLYNKQDRLESLDFGEELTVKANSIVFVECDLDFRLPYYMALRFNLQIRHVHRGLLLGTGPLVDPGYWGKLCIPLHNLTDEDYPISRDDGLIWVEFTKTTAGHQSGRPPLDLHEKKQGYWDIRKFLITYGVPWKGTVPQRVRIPPGKLSLQPVAIGADDGGNDIVRSTSVERVALGDPATMRAATRVNAEQASKPGMREPTRRYVGEGWHWPGSERQAHRLVPPGYWRRHAWKRGMGATREALSVVWHAPTGTP